MALGRLFLIDTFGLIFRAFYGRARSGAPLMRTAAGEPTEAVYIFVTMLRKLMETHRPDYVAATWESLGPTFRDEIFPAYKANRTETPDDLIRQMPYIKRLIESWRVPLLSADGYEADDVIGTLARQAAEHDIDVYIVTSDKDLSQLVTERVVVLNPMKNDLVLDPKGVKEVMGVEPARVVDLLALKGDSVDNIPGAPGIGDKGAKDLIETYGSVEGAIEHAAEVKRKTYRESLQQNQEQILLSKRLATIAVDAPVELDLESLKVAQPDPAALAELYRELEFNSLLSALAVPQPETPTESRTLASDAEFSEWLVSSGAETKLVTLAVDVTVDAELAAGGVAFCAGAGKPVLLPAQHLSAARDYLADPKAPKRVHDSKTARQSLTALDMGLDMALEGVVSDSMLEAFLLDASRSDFALDKALARYLGVPLDGDLARTADLVRRLGEKLSPEIDKLELRELYERIELPLAPILGRMEREGVLLDSGLLSSLSKRMEEEIGALAARIYELAGAPFNINSTQQLAKVLFDDLQLPAPRRRGKSKALSTASDVLEELAAAHEIVPQVLDYRQRMKLRSTYVDALPALVNPKTGRLHTTFNQCGAATGRLSSSNPNLQNIPIRTGLGREIRAAFVARPGWKLLAADYSQIELRVLADISRDPVLVEAFRNGEDIHTRTAAEVFGVPPLAIGSEERRRAKAVNFGIVYGLSPFGLSKQLGIPQTESRQYIDAYFERYSGVKQYMDSAVAQARKSGRTRTLLGRLRPIPDLDSRNPAARGFAERTAINSPIQGSAADLIKLAMIQVDGKLRAAGSRAVMLLQVHDELLFEAPDEELAELAKLVKREMEGVYQLRVPLLADVKAGLNWRDMKQV
ncbi:MAG TPA: DNA polymerase I [Bryobacterales bacterium]|nr:DNA polymerase I [Bryobacterales bacterium]